ncbi:DNA gyrase C-terminal beta-propeller domain-containing protein, partial [Klebsiella pneumoniae]
NAHVMPPLVIEDESDMLLAITAAGRMLMFPVSDLPQLSKGKGNKIISIPAAVMASSISDSSSITSGGITCAL